MGLFGSILTALTAPAGSTAYVITKDGNTLKGIEKGTNGKDFIYWNTGRSTLNNSCLYWNTVEEAKSFAQQNGLDISEIRIEWLQVY